MSRIFPETRMFGLSEGEEIMTLALFILIQYRRVTDRQTDGQTCRCRKDRAMHSVARVKIDGWWRQLHARADMLHLNRLTPYICMWGGVNCAKCFENRSKGFGAGRPLKQHFPLTSFIVLTTVSAVGTTLPHCDCGTKLRISHFDI